MGRKVVDVIKVVAPLALEALAKAAAALIADSDLAVAGHSEIIGADPEQDGQIVQRDTTTYVNTKFADNYRYFYKGLGSSPPHAQYPILGGTEDIIVWNPAKNETSDIQSYITTVMQDTLPDADVIEVAGNLSTLFQARFKDVELSWTPFNKRYNLIDTGVTIDLQMVTAAGYDSGNNPVGVATYCFVAYKTQ
jgi:hypothetical protein